MMRELQMCKYPNPVNKCKFGRKWGKFGWVPYDKCASGNGGRDSQHSTGGGSQGRG